MDNSESWGLIIFAFIALAAVFAFIIVLGGPPDEEEMTGELAGTQRIATSYYDHNTAQRACRHAHCDDGLPAIPTGQYDPVMELYECVCQTSNPSFVMWRSPWQKAG